MDTSAAESCTGTLNWVFVGGKLDLPPKVYIDVWDMRETR